MKAVLGILLVLAGEAGGFSPPPKRTGRLSDRVQADELKAVEAVGGIIQAFDRYSLVAIAESHGHRELYEFVGRLVTDPEFATKVNDIVLECGNALHQAIVDRYVAGEDVPVTEVQKAWRTSSQTLSPVFDPPMYGELFTKVRDVNRTLPKERRLRLLMGDPPIDWDKIGARDQAIEFLKDRDPHYERVVINEVLKEGRKALMIAGGLHFYRAPAEAWSLPQFHPGVGSLLERDYPGKLMVVQPISGPFPRPMDPDGQLGKRMEAYYPGAWIAEIKGTWLGAIQRQRPIPTVRETTLENRVDVVLYLGPVYTEARVSPFFYAVNYEYFQYKNRLRKLIFGKGFEEELSEP